MLSVADSMIEKALHLFVWLFILIGSSPFYAFAAEDPAALEAALQIDQRLGEQIDLGLKFKDTTGREVALSDYFVGHRPVIITPVYFSCPRLCGLLLDGALKLFKSMDLQIGAEYQVLSVSFNPKDSLESAHSKSEKYFTDLANTRNLKERAGWDFLIGDPEPVRALMQQIGFKYIKDKDDFAHSAILVLLTPDGKISRYFFGIDFPPWDVRLSLIEASQGGIGSLLDHALLLCFRFDPTKGKYTWVVLSSLRIAGAITVVFLVGFVFYLSRKYGRKRFAEQGL